MNLTIMIPDDKVSEMLATGKRICGSIGLANAKEGNFNAWRARTSGVEPERLECPLRCGKAVVTNERFRLHLSVKRQHVEFPLFSIQNDLKEANEFFEASED